MSDMTTLHLVEPSVMMLKIHDPLHVDSTLRNDDTTFYVSKAQAEAMMDITKPQSEIRWCGDCYPDKPNEYSY